MYKFFNNPELEDLSWVDKSYVFQIFDGFPPRMKIVVDLKMSRLKNKEIACILRISEVTVRRHLSIARHRFCRALYG